MHIKRKRPFLKNPECIFGKAVCFYAKGKSILGLGHDDGLAVVFGGGMQERLWVSSGILKMAFSGT